MIIQKIYFLSIFLLFANQSVCQIPLIDQFKQLGYSEIYDKKHGSSTFDLLYKYFDEFIEFLQGNQVWVQKLYSAKERFIRSKDKNYYSTDFFGFYDESQKDGRNQISFYYSIHFHEFICNQYPEFKKIPQLFRLFEACVDIQKSYENLFNEVASELGLKTIFSSKYGRPPILLKIIKYFPSYIAIRPHYDGTAFSLFLDSTDNQSLLLSPYKDSFKVNDFSSPVRKFSRLGNENSILLIPGALLSEYFIYPTPHIVTQSGKIRYATIAFAMRPNYISQRKVFSSLPNFKY